MIFNTAFQTGRSTGVRGVKAAITAFYARRTVAGFSLAGEVLDEEEDNGARFNLKSDVHSNDIMRTVSILSKQGRLNEMFIFFICLKESGISVNDYVYFCLLQLCINQKTFGKAMTIHDDVVRNILIPNINLSNTLINLYSKWGYMREAWWLFNRMQVRDLFSWSIIIEACANCEHPEDALRVFDRLLETGIRPDEICLLSVLKACGNLRSLKEGMCVHSCIIMCGLSSSALVCSSLVDIYVKCMRLHEAGRVFLHMSSRDVVAWNLMIAGHVDYGHLEEASSCLKLMQHEAVIGNGFTFVSIVKGCARLDQCKHVHVSAINSSCDVNIFFFNCLISLYFKFGASEEARCVFDMMGERDVVTWNSLLSGYVQQGLCPEALEVFERMEVDGFKPDNVTLASALKACTGMAALEEGKEIHRYSCLIGMGSDKFVASTLIDLYGKCGQLEDAQHVFDNLSERDGVTWNSMMSVFVDHEYFEKALHLFQRMSHVGVKGDDATFTSVLKACASMGWPEQGKQVHAYIIENGAQLHSVENTLIDMYVKCHEMYDARAIFNKLSKMDVVSWNVIIAGYARHGHSEEALDLFQQMQVEDVKPDNVTFLGLIKACTNLKVYEHGKLIEICIKKAGFASDIAIRNALVDMYCKCNRSDIAASVFNESCERDVVSWNAVITGYSQLGDVSGVRLCVSKLLQECIEPNEVTLIMVLRACLNVAAVDYGKQLHTHARETVYGRDLFVLSTLIDMYAKCGSIESASKLFEEMVNQDAISYNAIITGYAQHGLAEEGFKVLSRMQSKGVAFDHITYVAILSACSHMGLVEEGCDWFRSMRGEHDLVPSMEVYACVVDLFSRAGLVDMALFMVENMYSQPSADVGVALLSSCKTCTNNVKLAKYVSEHVLEVEPENSAAVVLLSNMFDLAVSECGE